MPSKTRKGERIDQLGRNAEVRAKGRKAQAPQDRPPLDCLTTISVKQKKTSDFAYHRVPGHEPFDFSP